MNKVPKIRFPEFNDEWAHLKLEDIAERIVRKNTNNETDLPLTISSIDGLIDQREYFNKTVASRDMSGYYLLKNGEFAYNKSYSVGYDYGSIKRLEKYTKGALSTLYICFGLKNGVYSDFLTTYFESQKWYNEIYSICAEGARNHGLLNVPTDDFFSIQLILPKQESEQKKISGLFDKLSNRILVQQTIITNLEEQKKGLMNKIFNQEVRFKADDCSDYPEWNERKIGNILKICHGRDYKHLSKGNIPVLGTGGILTYVNDFLCNWECVLIGRKGSIDKPQYMNIPFWTVDTLFYSKPMSNQCVKFQYYLFQYIDWKVYDESTGVPSLSASTIESIKVKVPVFDEQKKIADFFTVLDKKIEIEKAILEDWQQIKKGLLQQMFI